MVLAMAVIATLSRLVFIAAPLSPDEGGFLLVASHWSPGSATYGGVFVDRPPLLIAVYGLADLLGGRVALRIIGMLAVLAAVLLAGLLGGRYAGRRTGRWAAATAAIFLATPLFGVTNVDGELLAMPLLLGGLVALLESVRPTRSVRGRLLAAGLTGALGAGAVLIKQNLVDLAVALAAVCCWLALRGRVREAARLVVAAAAGAIAVLVLVLVPAALRGTTPARLWDALIVFRAQAGALIGADAGGGTTARLHQLLVSTVLSGAPLLVLAALVVARRPAGRLADRVDLRWVALPMLVWASVGALLGGSYWLHYLIELVPGLVLLMIAAAGTASSTASSTVAATAWYRPMPLLAGALVVALASTTHALVQLGRHPVRMADDRAVATYLRDHRHPGDTAVVAFGHPDILADAGMTSPYPYLWSLPARVRDARLVTLSALLAGPDAPRWVVVAGASLATWGIDATTGQQVLDARYRPVSIDGLWRIYERD